MGLKKNKRKKEPHQYVPPKELSVIGLILLMCMGIALVLYFSVNTYLYFSGISTEAKTYTRLQNGEVIEEPGSAMSSTLYYTFEDTEGKKHEGHTSTLGNEREIGDTVTIIYLANAPGISIPMDRVKPGMTQFGCLLLGVILVSYPIRQKRKKTVTEQTEEKRSG